METSLNDFHISYELNAYTDRANEFQDIYSRLHEAIQDPSLLRWPRSPEDFGMLKLLARRSLQIWEQVRGKEHPDVAAALNNLAEICRFQERLPEAETHYRRALHIFERN